MTTILTDNRETAAGELRLVLRPKEAAAGELRLALRPKEAAAALGISERLLWTMTKAGEVPHVRFGRAIVYPVAKLEAWLQEKSSG